MCILLLHNCYAVVIQRINTKRQKSNAFWSGSVLYPVVQTHSFLYKVKKNGYTAVFDRCIADHFWNKNWIHLTRCRLTWYKQITNKFISFLIIAFLSPENREGQIITVNHPIVELKLNNFSSYTANSRNGNSFWYVFQGWRICKTSDLMLNFWKRSKLSDWRFPKLILGFPSTCKIQHQ